MDKNIIVVQNAYEDITHTAQSISSIREAAHRWGVNFYEITHKQFPRSPYPTGRDRFWTYEEFKSYDKVLALDADIIINSKAPNIFDELTEDYDLCGVLDGNPGGRFKHNDSFLRDTLSRRAAFICDTENVFKNCIPNFDINKYWDNYINTGVVLFRPEKIYDIAQKFKDIVLNSEEMHSYFNIKSGSWFSDQNIFNGLVSVSNLRLKILANEWNWILPDIQEEWRDDFYLGPMKPWIYHFCGTPNSKDDLRTYDRWK